MITTSPIASVFLSAAVLPRIPACAAYVQVQIPAQQIKVARLKA